MNTQATQQWENEGDQKQAARVTAARFTSSPVMPFKPWQIMVLSNLPININNYLV